MDGLQPKWYYMEKTNLLSFIAFPFGVGTYVHHAKYHEKSIRCWTYQMENAIKLSGLVLFINSKIVHHGAVTIRHPRKKNHWEIWVQDCHLSPKCKNGNNDNLTKIQRDFFFESRLYAVTVFVYRSNNYYPEEAWQIEIVSHIGVNCKVSNYLTNVLILWQTNASFNRHISGAMEQILTGRKLILSGAN